MANYEPIHKTVLKVEGGWVDDPDDSGGETWQGVARNHAPKWEGWKIIDNYKRLNPKTTAAAYAGKPQVLNKILYADAKLSKLVYDFYKKNYWDVNQLDHVNDQKLAGNVYDCGVNCGTGTAAKMLQNAVNKIKPGLLKVDGDIGSKTIEAVNSLPGKQIYNLYNELRAIYYNGIIARKPSQAKFKKSWFSRIKPY